MRKILIDQRLVARDQNKVFVVRASERRLAAADVVDRYRLKPGKGNAYIEFDVSAAELGHCWNAVIQVEEWFVDGDVNLSDRNPMGFHNH